MKAFHNRLDLQPIIEAVAVEVKETNGLEATRVSFRYECEWSVLNAPLDLPFKNVSYKERD